ncbi:maspardin-like [Amphibalanus amphitrite]|uniref:maspardin-like n=1 Tax=Amphibalanus amphitrite TaxID=1232801 RepID=UPI001C9025C5|nr:maspardin-like [Amphibalanus amphitrite]XP_043239044.1 maspardin-like [Amphibalanus amphitrite]XP_043239045.1 maspardin-like [Amphibalanus amphitrite]XP_043239046.1 maspardin-like [Amphibalanus amphitrite]XP_043239047.1 maspardin-like [Amphibalanus amphitrite]XP_043239048.1 maspardin-like [Amphibalanus amphitrite]XP_043239049.1 maspardin-like [Amphibalanus amphitrite]XP_043239050.1 maspardin-like [Amphibalanus amphitrite]XP_043239051.1 maspardin-like [Amphibalanus amphitrite]
MQSNISKSEEYLAFRSTVALKSVIVDHDDTKVWRLYDVGPRSVSCPIVFLPPLSGTADVFFRQLLSLSSRGYRVLSVSYPVYWSVQEFCEGFRRLLDELRLDKVHLFGSFLGAFLAQKFAEATRQSPRVASLLLCQAFVDTRIYKKTAVSPFYWLVPGLVLKNMILQGFPSHDCVRPDIANSFDFMVDQLSQLSQAELASRLTLSSTGCRVAVDKLRHLPVTLLQALDATALTEQARAEAERCYPHARVAHLKTGGNFPFLTRPDETDMFIQVHVRPMLGHSVSPREERGDEPEPVPDSPVTGDQRPTGASVTGDQRPTGAPV